MRSDTSKMNVIENKEVGGLLLELCRDSLMKKGFTIEHSMMSSVGLLMSRKTPYRIVETVADQQANDEDLSIGTAPFYIHEKLEQDTIFRRQLASPQKKEGVTTFIPEAIRVGEQFGSGMLMIILLGGMNVSNTNTQGAFIPYTAPMQGVVGVRQTTRLSVLMFIINTKNGEVVWDDRVYKNGGIIFREKILTSVSEMLIDLP
jgi:hypothetical protein